MTLDRATIEAFATAIQRARPGQASPWDNAGIKSALARCQGEPWEILRAAATSAGNPDHRTPGLIPEPGEHWTGTLVGKRQGPSRCPEHPRRQAWSCPECAAQVGDADAGLAAVRAAIRRTR